MTRGENQPASRVAHPLSPVFDRRSQVLILGTMPSPGSRAQGFYYSHPQNRFWPVLADVLAAPLPVTNEQKRQLLLTHKIALWDVLASCEIQGASDSSIRNAVPNDLNRIFSAAPIRAVFTTGATAERFYRRFWGESIGLPLIPLPSTSPANARWGRAALAQRYRLLLEHLDEGRPL